MLPGRSERDAHAYRHLRVDSYYRRTGADHTSEDDFTDRRREA
jgi:hypothetical protein